MSSYIPTIGLEIHAELKTNSKMFCACKNDPLEKEPNVNICPVCMGHPGTLPVPNETAIRQVVKVGLALGCTIAEFSKFDRKNYFYPDLPKGYQISQYDLPFCSNGYLDILTSENLPASSNDQLPIINNQTNSNTQNSKRVRITRIHLEEDTGKSQHPANTDYSLVDFNRAGVPLMELVTEPDIENAKEAGEFGRQLQLLLRYLGVSDANMEKGQMRVEANISIRLEEKQKLGTKVEVKNLNSFRAVEQAIEYEVKRQGELLDKGEQVLQETRGWDEQKQQTFSQREKENAHDYRYFPEPDIPPITFTEKEIEIFRMELPELPQARKLRFQKEYALDEKQTDLLIKDKDLGEYFEHVASELASVLPAKETSNAIQRAANYITSDLQGLLSGMSVENSSFNITAENFAELIGMLHQGKIVSPAAKTLLKKMFETGGDPSQLLESEGLNQQFDEVKLTEIAKEIIANNPKAAEDYSKGKENALQFLIGQMMAQTKGASNPDSAKEIIKKLL